MKRVSILATGTEVVSGQIINTNAAWLAQKLDELKFDLRSHIVVGDEASRVLQALEDLTKISDFVFVIGGLGPTTDDLTRKIVSDWLNKDLKLNNSEWERIQKRLQSLSVQAREGHKWQAYFPEGARVYVNGVGTASGFSLQSLNSQTQFYFLPGPPQELQFIWSKYLQEELKALAPSDGLKLTSWQFIDIAESEVAHIAEPLVAKTGWLAGYRASPPIVELKVWAPYEVDVDNNPYILEIEKSLTQNLHSKNAFNYMLEFLKTLDTSKIALSIEDHLSQGEVLERVLQTQKPLQEQGLELEIDYATSALKSRQENHIVIQGELGKNLKLEFFKKKSQPIIETEIQASKKMSPKRFAKWVSEKSFKFLYEQAVK